MTPASSDKNQRTWINHYKREISYFTGLDMRNRVEFKNNQVRTWGSYSLRNPVALKNQNG
ncbi:hypothetical protein D0A34_11005 [Microcoleus vaginatus PCC 9802]|nr:hypothetical protein D0A34_11005 [Microcoleus vaginatus PCC 9802]